MLTELAAAKINLTLRVLGRRADGYHALDSLVAFTTFGDGVTLAPADALDVLAHGRFADAIDAENLVHRAALAVRALAPAVRLGCFAIEKRIPVAAGLGGGSTDAAAALRLIRRCNPQLAALPWPDIALRLGADVPACLEQRPCVMWGIGERLQAAPRLPTAHLVLVNTLGAVPRDKTAAVFRRLNAETLADEPGAPQPLPDIGSPEALADLVRTRGNTLLAPALAVMPDIAGVLAALSRARGCLAASLSGGGPTCFGLFADAGSAQAAAHDIGAAATGWWVHATALA